MERDSWDELFDEIYLETYAPLERGGDAEEQALGAVRLAGVEPGADVLDAPCGYGRHSLPLARAGYRVTGLDRSEPMLAEAHRRAGDVDNPRWVRGDHRELPFEDASFDLVLNLFSSLGFRGEDGDRRTLGEFARVLRPGGALIVETMHRDRLMFIFQPRTWDQLPDGGLVADAREFDYVTGIVENTHTLVTADGRRRDFGYRIRCYTATELAHLLREAGFVEVECFGGFDRGEFSRETRLIMLARRS
jgi:ubiquinone/menaquinone biosynthesis C-methylase UbiE